jgi:hypothetical protein
MRLPSAETALIDERKIRDYLLSTSHPVGRFKAAFFGSLGYRVDQWELLEKDLRSLLKNDAIPTERTEYGQKYEVRGDVTGPSGESAEIVTVWIVLEGEDRPRLITAFPGGEK